MSNPAERRTPEQEAEHFLNCAPVQWEYGINMTTKGYRHLLLNHPDLLLRDGRGYDIKGKSLGAGVYKVTATGRTG